MRELLKDKNVVGELARLSQDADDRGDEELAEAAQVVIDYIQGRRKLKDQYAPAGTPGLYGKE